MTNARCADRDGASPERWPAPAGLCASLLIITRDNTLLDAALPTVAHGLDATTTGLPWMVGAYVMVFAGLTWLTIGCAALVALTVLPRSPAAR